MRKYLFTAAALAAPIAFAHPALAAAPPPYKFGDPIKVSSDKDKLTFNQSAPAAGAAGALSS